MVESQRVEGLKPRKSARARANYTLLVPLILFAQSTDLLCCEALGRKRGVATDTQGPKTASQSLCAHNSHEQYGCSASVYGTMTSATISVTTLSPCYHSVLTAFLQLRYRKRERSPFSTVANKNEA